MLIIYNYLTQRERERDREREWEWVSVREQERDSNSTCHIYFNCSAYPCFFTDCITITAFGYSLFTSRDHM